MRVLSIPATDGYALAASVHEPSAEPVGLVVLAPATAVLRSYYDAFGAFLAREGFVVASFDYRGVGGSRPPSLRRFDARMRDWADKDLAGVIAWAQKERPGLPHLLVGHSVGGQVVGLADGVERLAGVVSVAAQHGAWHVAPMPMRIVRWLQWHVAAPAVVPLLGKLPRWVLGEELPAGVALEWARWGRSRDFLTRDDPQRLRERLARLRMPWLALSFGDDEYGPHENTDALMRLYPNVRLERRRVEARDLGVERVGHFGLFRPRFEATLWREVADWLRARADLSRR